MLGNNKLMKMKRKREDTDMDMDMDMVALSDIKSAIAELSGMAVVNQQLKSTDYVTTSSHHLPIKPFLALCNFLIQLLDKIGPTMSVLRQDIHRNIQRLEKFHDSEPSIYWDVVEIIKKESSEGKVRKGPSCSKAFVWLTRSLDFTLALLKLLVEDLGRNLEEAVQESYNLTLKPWHGWISSAAYKVALKLVPDSNTLVKILKFKDEDDDTLKKDMQSLISLLVPVLDQNKEIVIAYELDKLKST